MIPAPIKMSMSNGSMRMFRRTTVESASSQLEPL
ncbi:MAG: hypothetical protein QOE41_3975, partial [Mycobacterium sp.]|nr:hypothetical protein [Mycobacterium sp.]